MCNNVCPWWMGYFLLSPMRKIIQNPYKILNAYLAKGMNVLEVGSGMGYFSIPIANMVGEDGYVLSVDLQQKMLDALSKRIKKANMSNIVKTHKCSVKSLLIDSFSNKFDFALAFAVVHEISDQDRLFKEIYSALKNDGLIFIAEPNGHVSENDLEKSISIAIKEGFHIIDKPKIKNSHSVLLKK